MSKQVFDKDGIPLNQAEIDELASAKIPRVITDATGVELSQSEINDILNPPAPQPQPIRLGRLISIALTLVILIIAGSMVGCPQYKVYTQSMRGKADFKEAEINRQILVEEARAQEEALQMRARGEAEREKIKADASAYSVEKVGETLEANQSYLRWMWINEVAGGEGERIYIPTEAGMPILEAGR